MSERIIPARAGFTRRPASRSPVSADHPRSRGVYSCRSRSRDRHVGSSPLARGLHYASEVPNVVAGIIPARAGFTGWCSFWGSFLRDHPRSRGVYPASRPLTRSEPGSSPLARGLREALAGLETGGRIIPARAGFTTALRLPAASARDHPRSRGVYCDWAGCEERIDGSSPLARGLPWVLPGGSEVLRIIPARAGFTPSASATVGSVEDHPRSRGVYTPAYNAAAVHSGSSPLARGLRPLPRGVSVPVGIIPARAGFTGAVAVLMVVVPDHPRSRGVYGSSGSAHGGGSGSSPLARGLQPARGVVHRQGGIIPARAGFT